jgi:hypothetical protein
MQLIFLWGIIFQILISGLYDESQAWPGIQNLLTLSAAKTVAAEVTTLIYFF